MMNQTNLSSANRFDNDSHFNSDPHGPQSASSPVARPAMARRSRSTLEMPRPLCGPGVLHLCAATEQVSDRLEEFCARSQRTCDMDGATLSVCVSETNLSALVLDVMDVLTPAEQSATRAIFAPAGRSLGLSDYFAVDTFANFACKTLCGWLIEAIEIVGWAPRFSRLSASMNHKISSLSSVCCALRTATKSSRRDVCWKWRAVRVCCFNSIWARVWQRFGPQRAGSWTRKFSLNFAPTALCDPGYALEKLSMRSINRVCRANSSSLK